MDEHDLDVEGDDLFGWMRLVLGTVGAIVLPLWLMMSVVLASASPQIRYFDGDPADSADYLYTFDDETGERIRAERTHLQRLTIAGTQVGGIFFLLGVASSPLVLLWWLRSRQGRARDTIAEDDGLLDAAMLGQGLQVDVRRGGEGAAASHASPGGAVVAAEAQAPPADVEAVMPAVAQVLAAQAARADDPVPVPEEEAQAVAPADPAGDDEDLDRLFD